MNRLKLFIIALLAANILLFGLEASKLPLEEPAEAGTADASRKELPGITLLKEMTGLDLEQMDRQCFTVGPFETLPTVEAIIEMLTEYTSQVKPRTTQAFVDRGYWVYLLPFETEISARKAFDTLYEAGYDDLALIKDGEFNNSVSLGYFISLSNATRQRDRVRELGFPAEFRIQREDEARFWVDYQQKAGVEYASRVLSDLVPPELHRPTACADINDEPVTDGNAS